MLALQRAGASFPKYHPSPYLKYKREIKKSGPFEERDVFDYYFQREEMEQSIEQNSEETKKSKKMVQLEKDLQVVMDNVVLTNSIIDTCVAEKEMDDLLPDMISSLK